MPHPDKFDYLSVDVVHRENLKQLSGGIRALRLSTGNVIDLGAHLISAKKIVKSRFGRYCEEAVQIGKRSAQHYMAVAKLAQSFDREIIEMIPVAAAEQLAKKSCPNELRLKILEEVRLGRVPTQEAVKTRIAYARGQSAHKATNLEADRLRQKLQERLDASSLDELAAFLLKSNHKMLKDFATELQSSGGPEHRQLPLLEYFASA
jgi:hypothetical protein